MAKGDNRVSPFRKFITQFSHFFTGMGLGHLLGLITFPILTRALTKEQYGILGLVTTTMLFAVALSKAGLSDGIIRFHGEYSAPAKRTIFSSTVFLRGLAFSVISVILYLALLPFLSGYFKLQQEYVICFAVMAVYLFIRPLNIIVLNFLRVNDKTVAINTVNVLEKGFSIWLALILLLYVVRELYGYFIGVAFAEFASGGFLLYWFFRNYKVSPGQVSGPLAVQLIKFGLPLLVSEAAFLALSYVDRYLVVAYHGEAVLGLYSVGYNLAMYISNMLMFAISYSIVPIYVELYNREGKEATEAFLQKGAYYLLLVLIPISFGYAAVARDLFITLASQKYEAAAVFSPVILVGTLFITMNSVFNAGLYLQKKSMMILVIMLSAVALKIILNILLLPSYNTMGAAIATLVPCVGVTVLSAVLAKKYIRVRIDVKKVLYSLMLSLVMFFTVVQISTGTAWLNLVLKVLAGTAIIAAGTLYKEKEIRDKLQHALLRRK